MVNFLKLKDKGPACLDDKHYLHQRLMNFRFAKRHPVEPPTNVTEVWLQVRKTLQEKSKFVFENLDDKKMIENRAEECLV